MPSPRWRKLLRDASLHKARTLLVILAVTVGMIAAGVLLDAWALVRTATATTYRTSHPPSATLHIDTIDETLLAKVRGLPQVAAVRARRTLFGTVRASGGTIPAEIFSISDWNASDIGRLRSEQGVWPPRDGEIVVEHSSVEFSGIAPGQTVDVRGVDRAESLPVTGVARDVGLPPGWMEHLVYAFATPATLSRLGAPPGFGELQFVVRDESLDREAIRRIAYQVRALAEQEGHQVTAMDVPVPGQHPHAAQMDSLMMTQGAFALLTLLVCALLVVNLVTAMLAAQAREIAVMKTLGASARQIGAMYLVFALLLGAAASLPALPAAVAIARPYAALKADMLNFPLDGTSIPWWAFALQLAVGCCLPVAAAAIPVAAACRASVVLALSNPGIATQGGYLRRRLTLPGVGRPLQLSIGNAFRKRQRLLLTLLALAAGGAVYIGADNLRTGVRASVDRIFSAQHYDAVLRMNEARPASGLEGIAGGVEGVSAAEALPSGRASVRHADGLSGNRFALVGVAPQSRLMTPLIDEGRWLAAGDRDAIVVTRSLLKDEPSLHPDAEVALDVDGRATRWHVVGVTDAGAQSIAYVPASALAGSGGDAAAAAVVVAMAARDAAGQLDTVLRLRAALERAGMSVASSQLMGEVRRVYEDHLLMVVQFLGAMAWVMIAVGAIGLASTMSVAVLERTREVGVMRAIGADHRAIKTIIQVEGLVIACLAWLLSLPLSLPVSGLLGDAFGKVMFTVPVPAIPGTRSMLIWLLMLVVVSIIACAWPARRATRVPAAQALGYE